MTITHASDCAIYNAPAYPPGPCNCGAVARPPLYLDSSDPVREAEDREAAALCGVLMDNLAERMAMHPTNALFATGRAVWPMPPGLTVMPNNICNANCTFCAYQFNEEPKAQISFELFRRALDSRLAAGHLRELVLTPVAGEPLAHPEIFEMIAYARGVGVKRITMTTNGILLDRGAAYERLVDAGPDVIHVSTPGLNAAAYKRMYRSDRYGAMLNGLLKLLSYRENKPASPLVIKLHMRLDRPRSEAMADADLKLVMPYLDSGLLVFDDVISDYDNWGGHITAAMIGGTATVKLARAKPVPCERMITDLAVLPDGQVRVCSCRYFKTNHDELVIGSVETGSIAEIVGGERHRALLADVARGRWPAACRECSLYEPVVLA